MPSRLLALVCFVVAVAACTREPCVDTVQLEFSSTFSSLAPATTASGIDFCGAGAWNRVTAETCTADAPTATCDRSSDVCTVDDDCGQNARCLNDSEGGCFCQDFCTTDDDCAADEACLCTAAHAIDDDGFVALIDSPRCVSASCRTNTDCGAGGECGVAVSEYGVAGLRCRGPFDLCRTNADCGGEACLNDGDGSWSCGLLPVE
jgi:hypothetical protein